MDEEEPPLPPWNAVLWADLSSVLQALSSSSRGLRGVRWEWGWDMGAGTLLLVDDQPDSLLA